MPYEIRKTQFKIDKENPENTANEFFEHLVAQGIPHEAAAELAEEARQDIEETIERNELMESLRGLYKNGLRILRWHRFAIVVCVALAVVNAISVALNLLHIIR